MSRKDLFTAIIMYSVATLFLFYEMAIQISPGVMTDVLMRDFHIDSSLLGWMAASYFYSYTAMQIPAGMLYDHFGPRTLLTAGSFFCAVGLLFFSETTIVFWATVGRFLMGIGSSVAFIGVLVIAARWFEKKSFVFLVGLAQLLATLGAISGAMPLAKAVNDFGWRYTIRGLSAIGFLLLILSLLVLKDNPPHAVKKNPFRDKSLKRHLGQILEERQTWCVALYALTGWAPVVVFAGLWGVPFLKSHFAMSSYMAAAGTTMALFGVGICSIFVGGLSNWLQLRNPVLWMGSLIGLITSLIILYMPRLNPWIVLFLLFLMGVGSSAHVITFGIVRDLHKPHVVATAIGFNNMAVVIGGALFQPLVGWLLDLHFDGTSFTNGVPIYSVSDYQTALIIIPALYLFGFFMALFGVKETHCHTIN